MASRRGPLLPLRVVALACVDIHARESVFWCCIVSKLTLVDPLRNFQQEFLSNPGAMDVAVHDVFSDSMAKNLFADMAVNNAKGLSEVEKRWSDEYRSRKIISGFLKDKSIGKKRLASMPDRVTNTINTADGGKALRPTVINCVATDIQNLSAWWQQWRDFMFVQPVTKPLHAEDAHTTALFFFQTLIFFFKHCLLFSTRCDRDLSIPYTWP